MRRECGGNRCHCILVLLLLLVRCHQCRCKILVRLRRRTAPDCSGENARCHNITTTPHQQLRRRANETVDGERPAFRIALGQARHEKTRIDRIRRLRNDVACQHHFVQLAAGDALHRFRDRALPRLRVTRALAEDDIRRRGDRPGSVARIGGRSGEDPRRRSHRTRCSGRSAARCDWRCPRRHIARDW